MLVFCAAAMTLAGCALPKPHAASTQQTTKNESTNFPPLLEGITSFGAATDDGYLYVFGGYTGKRHDYSIEKVRGTFYRIRLANDGKPWNWEPLQGSEPAQGTAIVAYGHYIYRIGGMSAKNHEGNPQDLVSQTIFERYDIQKNIWEQLTPLPEGRSTHDAVIIGDKLYVGGGWDLNGDPFKDDDSAKWHDTLLVSDLSRDDLRWESLHQPFKRRALAMTTLGSKIYFIGGMDSNNDTSREVDIYDTASGIWTKGPDLPRSTMDGFGFAAIGADNTIYASGFSGNLLRLSADGTYWETIAKLEQSRFFHRLVLLDNNHLLAIGGEGKHGKLQDVETLSISR